MRHLLDARGLALDAALAADLYDQTGGNAQMLILAIEALKRSSHRERLIAKLELDKKILAEAESDDADGSETGNG